MTVGELKALLADHDDSRIVILAHDRGGNGYKPMRDISTAAYRAESTWQGEVGLEELTEEDRKAGYSEEDVMTNGTPCVVLWPVH